MAPATCGRWPYYTIIREGEKWWILVFSLLCPLVKILCLGMVPLTIEMNLPISTNILKTAPYSLAPRPISKVTTESAKLAINTNHHRRGIPKLGSEIMMPSYFLGSRMEVQGLALMWVVLLHQTIHFHYDVLPMIGLNTVSKYGCQAYMSPNIQSHEPKNVSFL